MTLTPITESYYSLRSPLILCQLPKTLPPVLQGNSQQNLPYFSLFYEHSFCPFALSLLSGSSFYSHELYILDLKAVPLIVDYSPSCSKTCFETHIILLPLLGMVIKRFPCHVPSFLLDLLIYCS